MAATPTARYLPIAGAAQYLGCSRRKIYDLLRENRLTARRIGRNSVVDLREIDALVANAPAVKIAAA